MTTHAPQNENPTIDAMVNNPPSEVEESTTAQDEALEPELPPTAEEIVAEKKKLREQIEMHGGKKAGSILEKAGFERELKPFQAELILMQKYLEESKRRMIILFEGRDA